jgi:uncharacterized protein (TIGR00369 family)
MDSGAVKNLIENLIPFVKKTGVLVEDLSPTKVKLKLPLDPLNLNPMGILHAGATFTLAETAAAALCVMALPNVTFIGKGAEIKFKRAGRGDVFAVAQLTPVDAQRIVDSAMRDGKVDAPIAVEVVDPTGELVAAASVTMSVRRLG